MFISRATMTAKQLTLLSEAEYDEQCAADWEKFKKQDRGQ